MRVDGGQRLRFVPRIVGEQTVSTPSRMKKLDELSQFMQSPDKQVSSRDRENLIKSMAEQNHLRSALAKKHSQLSGRHTDDMKNSVTLLRYVTKTLKALKVKVDEQDSNNLLRLYNGCVRGVTYLVSGGYLERSFEENEKRFLEIEPILTTCCTHCGISSAGDDIEGILVASFVSPESALSKPERKKNVQADIISLAANRGKPFKDEKEIRKAMEDAGTLGIYRKLREQPGFDGYQADFQDKVDAFVSIAKMAWERDVSDAMETERKEMVEFMKIRNVLLGEMVDFLPLLNATKEKWKPGSEIHQLHTRNCAFLSLLDLTGRASEVAQKQNIIGLYGLVAGLRDAVSKTLSDNFFKKMDVEIFYDYLQNIEPQLVAFSKLSGMEFKDRSLEISSQHDAAFLFYEQSVAYVNEKARARSNQ